MPDVGQKAPLFNLLDQSLNRFELGKALTKGKILLVFYPGDNTPVCTAQLCDYRDNYKAFEKLGVQIYGINISTTESHKAFAEKLHLPFPLLNDYDSRVTKSYKVMSFMGTPKRALFLIGEDGKILYKYVELLPIFRRSSEELLKEVKKVLPQPAEAVSQS
jgi:peroxiredoxin Q/BCP